MDKIKLIALLIAVLILVVVMLILTPLYFISQTVIDGCDCIMTFTEKIMAMGDRIVDKKQP
jgi:hypothetical protein